MPLNTHGAVDRGLWCDRDKSTRIISLVLDILRTVFYSGCWENKKVTVTATWCAGERLGLFSLFQVRNYQNDFLFLKKSCSEHIKQPLSSRYGKPYLLLIVACVWSYVLYISTEGLFLWCVHTDKRMWNKTTETFLSVSGRGCAPLLQEQHNSAPSGWTTGRTHGCADGLHQGRVPCERYFLFHFSFRVKKHRCADQNSVCHSHLDEFKVLYSSISVIGYGMCHRT